MLTDVVDTAWPEQSRRRFAIAAKTGTAQVPKPDGGYYGNQYNHTFFGYFPAYEPEYLVFLMIREPQGVRFASQTLTDPFMNITDFLINYYNIPPDR
jgi:cell division protein FtsI/penicillin-binding protein 2